jgi:hypothetical protein
VLPFGYAAHEEAADPAAPLHTEVTVSADGIVREITVTWGTNASSWTCTVAYSRLGATPAPARSTGHTLLVDGAGPAADVDVAVLACRFTLGESEPRKAWVACTQANFAHALVSTPAALDSPRA